MSRKEKPHAMTPEEAADHARAQLEHARYRGEFDRVHGHQRMTWISAAHQQAYDNEYNRRD